MQQQNIKTARRLTAEETRNLCTELNGVTLIVVSDENGYGSLSPSKRLFSINMTYSKQPTRKTCIVDMKVLLGSDPVEIPSMNISARSGQQELEINGEQLSRTVVRFELPMDKEFVLKAALIPAAATPSDTSLFENYISRIKLEDLPTDKLPMRLILDPAP